MNLVHSTNTWHSTNFWHPCYVRSGPTHMPLYWGGFVAACLLRSAIRCVRGSHSSAGSFCRPVLTSSVGSVQAETGLTSLVL